MKSITSINPSIFTIDNFLSPSDCEAYIAQSEAMGYAMATVNTGRGQAVLESVRNNNRVLHKDFELANELWQDLAPLIPNQFGNTTAIGLNELFRFYRYSVGQQFKLHRDQSYIRNDKEWSSFTFLIYLNDNYEGGDTVFDKVRIKPKQGMALIFEHHLLHEGATIEEGVKYVLRSDIMYRFND